jgi:thioredoxin-related protein
MTDKESILLWYSNHGCDTLEKIKVSVFNEEKLFLKAGIENKDEAKEALRKRFNLIEISFTEEELEKALSDFVEV